MQIASRTRFLPRGTSQERADGCPILTLAVVLATNLDAAVSARRCPRSAPSQFCFEASWEQHKAGAARIVVVIDRAKGPGYSATCCAPAVCLSRYEWCGVQLRGKILFRPCSGSSLPKIRGHLVLIAGDRVYHPSLHRRAGGWDEEAMPLALVTGNELVGICSLSRERRSTLHAVARQSPAPSKKCMPGSP